MPKLLTIRETAEALRLSVRTVYDKARAGELPCFRVGRRWRVRAEELQRIIDRSGRRESVALTSEQPA